MPNKDFIHSIQVVRRLFILCTQKIKLVFSFIGFLTKITCHKTKDSRNFLSTLWLKKSPDQIEINFDQPIKLIILFYIDIQ